jgi:hypothetical protein
MEPDRPGANLSHENLLARTEQGPVLEEFGVEVSVLGNKVKVLGRTAPDSNKSLAECFLYATLWTLALSGGLGEVCKLLGGPTSWCLTAASVGLMISVALTVALAIHIKRHDGTNSECRLTQQTVRVAASATDLPLGGLSPMVAKLPGDLRQTLLSQISNEEDP